MDINSTNDADIEDSVNQKWGILVIFIACSTLSLWEMFYGNLSFKKWDDWFLVAAAFGFPIASLTSASSLAKDSRLTGAGKNLAIAIKWLLAAPFVIIALVVGGWFLYSIFGWFATIPSWAAVIIIILLLK